MKIDFSLVDKLWRETGKDYGFCEKVLKKYKNDYEKAKEYILNYDNKMSTKIKNNISNIVTGNLKYRFKLYSVTGGAIVDVPLIALILLTIFIPKFDYAIGIGLILLMITGGSLSVDKVYSKVREGSTVTVQKKKEVVHIKENMNEVHRLEDGSLYMEVK